ncbi:MAG: hypothetical protein GF387_02980 [Candidatus Portnoybacteria bacterium]|nr:hypothetical protein [Candidatus Portnoybacteria bacterium]
MIKKYLVKIFFVFLMLAIAWALFLLGGGKVKEKSSQANVFQPAGDVRLPQSIDEEYFPIRDWSVDDPDVIARSAVVVNFDKENGKDRVLFQKNSKEVLPIASLTKVMTAMIALDNFSLDEKIKVSHDSVMTLGNKGGLIRGEELSVESLLYIMLIESSNDAAMALARDGRIPYNDFISFMNQKVVDLGLENTSFIDPAGLDPLNQSTAMEFAFLVKQALNYPLIWDIFKIKETEVFSTDNKFIHSIVNTNKLLGKISLFRGGKTGYTNEAGECMMTLADVSASFSNNFLITIVLGSQDREEETEKLINWARKAYLWQ